MFLIAVIIPTILAGVRDYTIGTDIATYGHWLFIAAKQSSNPIKFAFYNSDIEFLYSMLVFCTAHLFESEHWLYFFTGLLIYGFAMKGLLKYKNYISTSTAWLCYLFLFYSDTLNAMRQCIAVAILPLAFSYYQKKDKGKFFIFVSIAFLFHKTAIFILIFVGIYELLKRKNDLTMRVGLLLTVSGMLFAYAKILDAVVNIGILGTKYLKYADGLSFKFSLNPIIIRIPYVFFIALFYIKFVGSKKERTEKLSADFIVIMMLLEILTAEMRTINTTLYRLSLYFGMYRCIGIGRLVKTLKLSNRMIVATILWILLIVTWIYQNVIQGNNQIYPFTSELIGL